MTASDLSPYELKLCKPAIEYAQQVKASDGRLPTQEELQRHLHCARVSAKKLQDFLVKSGAATIADKLDASHDKAVDKAIVDCAVGVPYKTTSEYLVRENSRLLRLLAKSKFENKTASEVREIAILEEIDLLKEQYKASIGAKPSVIKRSKKLSGNMLEVNIPDAHFGKMAWPTETGHGPWDTTITTATYTRAIDAVLERAKGYDYDEILYVVGNDILNSNDAENKTAHGTIVTTDGRYHKTFWKVRTTVVAAIERMLQIAPVRVMMVYGNHDTLAAWHLGDSLECYFHGYKDVIIENAPTYRKYYQFGKVMVMFTHGDKGVRDDYPLLMATEKSEMFGATKFHEVHIGHRHKTQLDEWHGVRVRILPALCQADDWHAENGYVGNLRNAEGYIWNKEEGLVGMAIYSDDPQEPIVTKRSVVKQ